MRKLTGGNGRELVPMFVMEHAAIGMMQRILAAVITPTRSLKYLPPDLRLDQHVHPLPDLRLDQHPPLQKALLLLLAKIMV
jgi:hypothetical protein